MSKIAKLYFSHDYGARNDIDMAPLLMDYRSAGYGIFWATVELMHEEGGSLEYNNRTFLALAKHLNEELTLVKRFIEDCCEKYKVFNLEGEMLTSSRVSRNLEAYKETKDQRSAAGKASAEAKRKLKAQIESMEKELAEKSTDVQHSLTDVQQNSTNKNKNKIKLKSKQIKKEFDLDEKSEIENPNLKTELEKDQHFAAALISYDALADLSKDQIFLDQVAMARGFSKPDVLVALEKYHLKREEKNEYPLSIKQMKSGFNLYLINLKNFKVNKNGQHSNSTTSNIGNKSEFNDD